MLFFAEPFSTAFFMGHSTIDNKLGPPSSKVFALEKSEQVTKELTNLSKSKKGQLHFGQFFLDF